MRIGCDENRTEAWKWRGRAGGNRKKKSRGRRDGKVDHTEDCWFLGLGRCPQHFLDQNRHCVVGYLQVLFCSRGEQLNFIVIPLSATLAKEDGIRQ